MNYWKALKQRPVLNRETAWGCLIANLLILPGLGTAIAGRKTGRLQMALSFAGGVAACIFLAGLTLHFSQLIEIATSGDSFFSRLRTEWGSWLLLGSVSLAWLVAVWVWGLLSSLSILWETRRTTPPPLSPPPIPAHRDE